MGHTFYIQNIASGLVLDIFEARTHHGAHLIVHPYHGNANQLWHIEGHKITSVLNGLALDIQGPSNQGQPLIMWPHHGQTNQQWHFDKDGTIRCSNGMALDIKGGQLVSHTPVIAWCKNGGQNQKWRIVLHV